MPFTAHKAEQPDTTTTHKAPSAGKKVTKNAPVTQEAPGPVEPGSLASESEAFRQANKTTESNSEHSQKAQEGSHEPPRPCAISHKGKSHRKVTLNKKEPVVAPAPTYVQMAFYRDPHGPHGKNITEDPSIGTKADKAKNVSRSARIGDKDDPSLLAEQKFSLANSTPAGTTAPRQRKLSADKGTFGVLDDEREA